MLLGNSNLPKKCVVSLSDSQESPLKPLEEQGHSIPEYMLLNHPQSPEDTSMDADDLSTHIIIINVCLGVPDEYDEDVLNNGCSEASD